VQAAALRGLTSPARREGSERPSNAWVGDRVALVVWLGGALTIAYLLLKDLLNAILFR
jgi:hypothetical protein